MEDDNKIHQNPKRWGWQREIAKVITVNMSSFAQSSISEGVDEMQQGLYPDRYYGWKDMVINSSGVLLVVFW